MKTRTRASIPLVCTAATLLGAGSARADTVVQIPVDSVIDGRSVSTLSGAAVVPWTPGQGVDGDGNADGFVTTAVEAVLFQQKLTSAVGMALPDDGVFPADARHPAVVLHFSNTAPATTPQTHQVHISAGAQTFHFAVPPATYSKLFLLVTSSEGAAALTVTLTYAAGTPASSQDFMLPDYGIGGAPANDPIYFNLIAGLRKWTTQDQETDTTSHTITGIELTPSATGVLADVQVTKTNGAHVVFWGATGIATSAVDGGSSGDDGGSSGDDGGSSGEEGGSVAMDAGLPEGMDAESDATASPSNDASSAGNEDSSSGGAAAGVDSGAAGGPAGTGANESQGASGCSLSGRGGGAGSLWSLLLAGWWATRRRRVVRARR